MPDQEHTEPTQPTPAPNPNGDNLPKGAVFTEAPSDTLPAHPPAAPTPPAQPPQTATPAPTPEQDTAPVSDQPADTPAQPTTPAAPKTASGPWLAISIAAVFVIALAVAAILAYRNAN